MSYDKRDWSVLLNISLTRRYEMVKIKIILELMFQENISIQCDSTLNNANLNYAAICLYP